MSIAQKRLLSLAALLAVAATSTVFADPPDHAPAHGWRRKHDHDHDHDHEHERERDYVGYTGEHWEQDYDVSLGRCNRQAVATAVGGVVGGAIASRVAKPENRVIATLIGAAAGALVGNRIGHELDEADRGCFGQALEIGRSGQLVTWTNDSTSVRYELTPGRGRERDGASCREYTLVTVSGRARSVHAGLACRTEAGYWQVGS